MTWFVLGYPVTNFGLSSGFGLILAISRKIKVQWQIIDMHCVTNSFGTICVQDLEGVAKPYGAETSDRSPSDFCFHQYSSSFIVHPRKKERNRAYWLSAVSCGACHFCVRLPPMSVVFMPKTQKPKTGIEVANCYGNNVLPPHNYNVAPRYTHART